MYKIKELFQTKNLQETWHLDNCVGLFAHKYDALAKFYPDRMKLVDYLFVKSICLT